MTPISYKAWLSPSPRAALILVHGLGGNSSWWESAGNFFLSHNISSYAIDLRSHGSFKEFFSAIRQLHSIIKKESVNTKIFTIGESMGALIILSMALEKKNLFSGLACISPAFSSRLPLTLPDYLKIFLPLLYKPDKRHALPVTSDMCTRDPEYLKMIESTYDKDVMQASKVLFDIFITQLYMRFSKMKISSPILFLTAGNDKLVYSDVSKKIFEKINAKDKVLINYPGMYHSLSIDIDKEKVFQDILDWMDRRI